MEIVEQKKKKKVIYMLVGLISIQFNLNGNLYGNGIMRVAQDILTSTKAKNIECDSIQTNDNKIARTHTQIKRV